MSRANKWFSLHNESDKQYRLELKFTRKQAVVACVSAFIVALAIMFCLVAYTPLRLAVPGYPDARTREAAIESAMKVDSLESTVMRLQLYTENLARALEGTDPMPIDSIFNISTAQCEEE